AFGTNMLLIHLPDFFIFKIVSDVLDYIRCPNMCLKGDFRLFVYRFHLWAYACAEISFCLQKPLNLRIGKIEQRCIQNTRRLPYLSYLLCLVTAIFGIHNVINREV